MAFIVYSPKYKGKRSQVVPDAKAREIWQILQDMPGDLSEDRYDYLKCVDKIYFNTKHGRQDVTVTTEHLLHEGQDQGMNYALPVNDR